MSPFDLRGPEFIAFWLAGWLFIALATVMVRRIATRPRARESPATVAGRLHPIEVAFLVGGIDRAVEAAVAGLHHRGFIEVVNGHLRATSKLPAVRRDGVFRGVVIDEPLAPLERYVLESLPVSIDGLRDGALGYKLGLERSLEERGLLVEYPNRVARAMRLPGMLWITVAAIKIAIGISRDRPVSALVFLAIGGLGILLVCVRPPRLTTLGGAVVRYVRDRYSALALTAKTAAHQLDAAEMTLAYGIYGVTVAPIVLAMTMPSYQAAAAASQGSSCGGTSGCSSCGGGGGCGGGCGGCGS